LCFQASFGVLLFVLPRLRANTFTFVFAQTPRRGRGANASAALARTCDAIGASGSRHDARKMSPPPTQYARHAALLGCTKHVIRSSPLPFQGRGSHVSIKMTPRPTPHACRYDQSCLGFAAEDRDRRAQMPPAPCAFLGGGGRRYTIQVKLACNGAGVDA